MKIFAAVLLSLLCAGWTLGQNITSNIPLLNFGNVYDDAPDSLSVTLSNSSGRDLTVTGIRFYNTYGSPPFTSPNQWFSISDGSSATIWVKFAPRHNIFHNSEMIVLNDGLRGPLRIDLNGQGKFANTYYDLTENLDEESLKSAINLITGNGYVSLIYGPARDSMFMKLDNKLVNGQGSAQNTLECVYTGREAVGYVDRTDCQTNFSFNTEHTFPQSFFTSFEPMRSDLHHLYPTDDVANGQRGDHPFGVVTSPSWSSGGSKSDGTIFEPRDQQKGAVARSMFYFVLRYQNYGNFLNSQEAILRSWHQAFPPTVIEKTRNEGIYTMQENRNPFVDYPVFIERITSLSSTSIAPQNFSIDLIEDTIVYGTIPAGSPQVYQYLVVNNGNKDIQFSNFSLSHPGKLSFFSGGIDTVVAPGDALVLRIQALTTNTDSINGHLSFTTNATGHISVSVPIYVNDLFITGIKEPALQFSVFPNPSHDRLTIDLTQTNRASFRLSDITGRTVLQESATGKRSIIDVSDFSPGIYFLHVESKNYNQFQKIIIQ